MRFTQTLSTLLLGASLSASVLAAPTATSFENKLQVRDQNLDDDVEADDETWAYFDGACGGGSARRDLFGRAPDGIKVEMTDSNAMTVPVGLWTDGLKPCVGLVVTGNKKGDANAKVRVLGHFAATKMMLESQWEKFKGFVTKDELENTRGFISHPDTGKKYPDDAKEGFYLNHEDAVKLSKEIEDELKDRLDDLVDGDPVMDPRDVDVAAEMNVDADNNVFVNGNKIS